jgi:hypothetical protein
MIIFTTDEARRAYLLGQLAALADGFSAACEAEAIPAVAELVDRLRELHDAMCKHANGE